MRKITVKDTFILWSEEIFEEIVHILYVQTEMIWNYIIFDQVFSLLLTDLLRFHLNILKSKMGLNHLLILFPTRADSINSK